MVIWYFVAVDERWNLGSLNMVNSRCGRGETRLFGEDALAR